MGIAPHTTTSAVQPPSGDQRSKQRHRRTDVNTRTLGPLPGSDSPARLEIILKQSYPLRARSAAYANGAGPHPSQSAPSNPDHNRYRVVVHRLPDDILSAVGGHLHASPIFFRTLSNPVSWNVASWLGPRPSNTLIFSRAPSGSDRRSSVASSL